MKDMTKSLGDKKS